MLADDEALDSPRVQAAAGPGNALAYHAAYEFGGDVTALPAGDVWLDTINQSPPQDRHLAVHDQHLVALNDADTAAWAAGSWNAIRQTTLTGTADEIGRRVSELAAEGITEIIYQPTGPDITGELEAFHTAARTAVSAVARQSRIWLEHGHLPPRAIGPHASRGSARVATVAKLAQWRSHSDRPTLAPLVRSV